MRISSLYSASLVRILIFIDLYIMPTRSQGNHCPARKRTCPWYDFRPTAEWVMRTYKTAIAHPDVDCPLIDDEIGITRQSVYSDWMHDKYLGTDKVISQPLF